MQIVLAIKLMLFFSWFHLSSQNDISQNNNIGSGSLAFSSEQSADANATLWDCCSTDEILSAGFNMQRASDLIFGFSIFAEPMKTEIIEHARLAMDELVKLGTAGHPLWQPQPKDRFDILNQIEYLRQFGEVDTALREIVKLIEVGEPQNLPSFDTYQTEQPASKETPTVALQTEASRDMAFINMSPISIVELLMDVVSYFFIIFMVHE